LPFHQYLQRASDCASPKTAIPNKFLKTILKVETEQIAWEYLYRDTSCPFPKNKSRRIVVKVIYHLGNKVMKVINGISFRYRTGARFNGAIAMTTTKKISLKDYLALEDTGLERPAEWIDGELIDLPPESGLNTEIAALWFAALLASGVSPLHLKLGNCEVQTPVLARGDAANRFPDLVVIREEHRSLTQHRMTITLEMPPPRFVLEVVSPGQANRDRDYVRKRAQYAAVGIPEYVIVDPETQTVTVLVLEQGNYQEAGCYQGEQRVLSPTFPDLNLTADQIFGVTL
jgi:Uma2 family endonuclease